MFACTLLVCQLAFLFIGIQGLLIEDSGAFPLGSEVENLVLRPSGSVLATVYTFPHIYEVATAANSTPRLIHTFSNTNGLRYCSVIDAGRVFYPYWQFLIPDAQSYTGIIRNPSFVI
jgi:hypothetical protein